MCFQRGRRIGMIVGRELLEKVRLSIKESKGIKNLTMLHNNLLADLEIS